MSPTAPDQPEGLRARKKRRTRQEISVVATRLFAQRGFEEVTLGQIAEAAEVSVKTIFNHFGAKEDLYFDRAGELRDALERTIVDRPPGTTVLGALRRLVVDNRVPFPGNPWDTPVQPQDLERFRAFLATQDRSPALRARRLSLDEELGGHLTSVIAGELGLAPDAPVALALGAMLLAALQVRDRVLRVAMAERAAPAEVRRRVVEVVEEAFDRLEAGFRAVDRVR